MADTADDGCAECGGDAIHDGTCVLGHLNDAINALDQAEHHAAGSESELPVGRVNSDLSDVFWERHGSMRDGGQSSG